MGSGEDERDTRVDRPRPTPLRPPPDAPFSSSAAVATSHHRLEDEVRPASVAPLGPLRLPLDDEPTGHGTESVSAATHARRRLEGTRLLLAAMIVFSMLGIVGVVLFPGPGHHGTTLAIAFGAIAAVSIPVFIRVMRAQEYAFDRWLVVHAIVVAGAVPAVTLGLGMLSPVSGVFVMAIMLFALVGPRRMVILTFLEIALGHALIAALAYADVVPSSGLRYPVELHGMDFVLSFLWVEGQYTMALFLGLLMNARYTQLVDELERVVRASSAREALLREVREELDRAANLHGPGRFTGTALGGFDLGEVIGRGGMGEVYAATRRADRRESAVKVLLRGMLADRELVARFQREARLVSTLKTPHVVEVLEVAPEHAEIPYLAMERLRGHDLASLLRSEGRLPTPEIAAVLLEVAAGLEVAHAAGIVHRDLKPSNVFRAESGDRAVWKILDFGIAKRTETDDQALTGDRILGTPQYMAPEQALRHAAIDQRVDVHALAAIAYRALTGRTPFTGEDVPRMLLALTTEVPTDPRLYADVGLDVALVLRIGLAKRPRDRFPTAMAFARALDAAGRGDLDSSIREQGHALLAVEPWGARVAPGTA